MILYHFPGCPYSERIEICLHLKGMTGEVEDIELDLSKPRPDWLLQKTRGSTALPVLDCGQQVLRESSVILRYLDMKYPERPIAHTDPMRHAIESLFGLMDSGYAKAGYAMLRNQELSRREELKQAFDAEYAKLDEFLRLHGNGGPFLFDDFGWAEVMFTPLLKRLECLAYYEDYQIPQDLERVKIWHSACLDHPSAQGRPIEQILKLYYDYSRDAGGGALASGRTRSSFAMEPAWQDRPLPPRNKWAGAATDQELGLV
jgi:glutathione S-transferase